MDTSTATTEVPIPEHATDTARELLSGPAFWEGYRSEDGQNPYSEPERPAPDDPHLRFRFGRNRCRHKEMKEDDSKSGPGYGRSRASRHKVGKERWFWIVGGDWHMVYFSFVGLDVLHHGIEPTPEKAVGAAREMYPNAYLKERSPAQRARRYWKMLKARERQKKDTSAGGSERIEFVYCVTSTLADSSYTLSKHRHIKTTPKRIFVAKERWDRERRRSGSWRDYDVKRLSLNREKMEENGFVKRSEGGIFNRYFPSYDAAKEYMGGSDAPPECLHVLGLGAGAGEKEIKEAFRTRSKDVHPDHGGDPAAFRRLRDAYEKALKRAE